MASNEEHYTLPRPSFDKPVKVLIVVAPYYKQIAEQLVQGARAEIEACGGFHETVKVPGALEVPSAIGIAGRLAEFDAYVALGCVIRGETTHYDTVCNDSSRALQLLGLQGLCIGNGILTVETYEQARVRAEAAGQNKGGGAAAAALHLLALARKWGGPRDGVGFAPARGDFQTTGDAKGPSTA